MKEIIITDHGRAYLFGITTMAFGMFLGSKLSPDYLEFVSNGNNFLGIAAFGMAVFLITWLIDRYFKNRSKDSFK